jgi:ankyrin repeat protein
MLLGLVVAASGLAAAGTTPAPGRASGAFSVDGKPVTLAYAYAQVEIGSDGKPALGILLTEEPVPAALIDGENRLADVLQAARTSGLVLQADAKNEASGWSWIHPDLRIGCGFCSDLQLVVVSRTADKVQGEVRTAKPQSWQKQKYEFAATFDAKVRKMGGGVAAGTPAQEAARQKIRQDGKRFTAADFFINRTTPDAVKLFLDAGMSPDTLSPEGSGETLLLDVLSSDCADPEVKQVALMLVKRGANVNYRTPDGTVPLLRAYKCADVVQALLDAGADLKAEGPTAGQTVGQALLKTATTFDKLDVVRLLNQRGVTAPAAAAAPAATRTTAKPSGASASTVRTAAAPAPSAARSPEEAKQELGKKGWALTEEGFWARLMDLDPGGSLLYLDAGQSPNLHRPPPQSDTPLLYATSACAAPDQAAAAATIALGLVGHGADVNSKSDIGVTPLMSAAQYCPLEVVEALLRAHADANAKSRGGATALAMAVMAGKTESVKAILATGYSLKNESWDPLAAAAGHPDIEKLLRAAKSR